MVLLGIIEIIKGKFMSLGFVYFEIHSLMLIHGQVNNTVHYSLGIL